MTEVDQTPYILAKVTRVLLFGSMLKPKVDWLSDVDVAVELARNRISSEDTCRIDDGLRSWPTRAAASGISWNGRAAGIGKAFQFLKGAKSRDRPGRFQRGKDFRAGGSASDS